MSGSSFLDSDTLAEMRCPVEPVRSGPLGSSFLVKEDIPITFKIVVRK
jgi:hypothetical protein